MLTRPIFQNGNIVAWNVETHRTSVIVSKETLGKISSAGDIIIIDKTIKHKYQYFPNNQRNLKNIYFPGARGAKFIFSLVLKIGTSK